MWCLSDMANVDNVAFLTVVDPADWVAYSCTFRSPIGGVLLRKTAKHVAPQICLVSDGPPTPLLRACAENAFFDLPQLALREMCKTLGVTGGDDDLLSLLQALIRREVPKITEDRMVEILSLRMKDKVGGWASSSRALP